MLGSVLALAGCGNDGGGGGGGGGSGFAAGTLVENPDPNIATYFVVEKGQGGSATSLKIANVFWGRLVTIKDFDSTTNASTERFRDFVIGDNIVNDGVNYRLDRNPVTEQETLTILHPFGSIGFNTAFDAVDDNLQIFQKKSLDPSEVPPFTAVPRNAAVMVQFNDLLQDGGNPGSASYPGTVNPATVKLFAQNPPIIPFEARIIPDPNHGDVIGGQFHSTRVILDLAVSETEASSTNLPVNSIGLPEADTTLVPNAVLRIPTEINSGGQQFTILTNLAGHGVSFTGNGPTEPNSPALDVVRAFRSMGDPSVTGDPNNGFLPDEIAPLVLGSQVVTMLIPSGGPSGAGNDEFIVDVQFEITGCAASPRAGDIFDLSGDFLAQVLDTHTGPIINGRVDDVHIQLLTNSPSQVAAFANAFSLDGLFKTAFDGSAGQDPRCFVRFLPGEGAPPGDDVSVTASIVVTFSEPIDPVSVQAFDTYTINYDVPPSAGQLTLYEKVVGHIVPSADLRKFTFEPEIELRHTLNQADGYTLRVLGGAQGVTDLAGNSLVNELAGANEVPFRIDPTLPTQDTASISLRFDTSNENGQTPPGPAIRGQFFFDIDSQAIRPRAVQRFSQVADPSVPVVGAMIALPTTKLQTPLSNHGSKLHAVWRYHDLSLGMLDDQTHNLDIEGLNWSPFANQMLLDNFTRFQMALAHCKFLPDEELSSGLLPNWPGSGLAAKYEDNLLDKATDPLTIVHPAAKGYTVNPVDSFTAASTSGFTMTPWPLNQGVGVSQFNYWTWRDTAKIAVGGPNGNGADTQRLQQITKVANTGFYTVGKVPTIALPLLMEFRTYADGQASGQNGFRIAIAINSSANPYFRAFTTGYVTCSSGAVTDIDPDTLVNATGGYDPVNCITTNARDDTFYYGQADFITRVSRAHTAWFDTLGVSQFQPPVVEPSPSALPSGTQIVLAFRGASSISPVGNLAIATDARFIDSYGDAYNGGQLTQLGLPAGNAYTPSYFNTPPNTTDKSWESAIASLNGARYFQVRVSFLSNPETLLTPELSALGFAFKH